MSSKGAQETTNDGSDAKHREKIASHYKGWSFTYAPILVSYNMNHIAFSESAKTKTGIKWYLLFTLLVDGLIGAHVYLKKAKVFFIFSFSF